MNRVGISMVVAVAISCNADTPEAPEPNVLGPVTENGPHNVGTMESSFTGFDGVEIPVQAWYPTSDASGTPVTYDEVYPGDSWEFASADCDSPRPVVLFSHGNGGVRWQSAFNMHFLASHGFLVVAMDHVTNTFMDLDSDKFPQHTLQRPRDVSQTFDWLIEQSADASSFLSGCVDPNEGYAVMGHSFGGYTTYVASGATLSIDELQEYCAAGHSAACEIIEMWHKDYPDSTKIDLRDERVWAAVTWAPWDAFGVLNEGMEEVHVPTLTLTGTRDETTPLGMVDGLVSSIGDYPSHYGKIINTGHFAFSPIACLVLAGDGCGDGYLDVEVVKEITNQSVTPFLAQELGWKGAKEQFPPDSDHVDWD